MWGRPSSVSRGSDRFVTRRRLRRRHALIALCILILLLTAGIVYELRQNAVRISHIQIFGADQSFETITSREMQGNYLGIIPRDSTFFFPASHIRTDIMTANPNIAAVSFFRNGFTGLSIKVSDRVPIARWCGLAPTIGVDAYCYVFDASGFIFAAATTSAQTINSFTLYAPLEGETLGRSPTGERQEPLRANIAHANNLPALFDFARQLDTFGSSVTHIILHNDEVNDYLTSGTRVTYLLGNEQNAFTALVSARDNFNLADGSVDYIDLRFDGKMYLKRK
jgi:hypothetical protein